MELKVDFYEVDAPTGKQVDLVQQICRVLELDKPKDYTFKSYSSFIDTYMEEYLDTVWARG